MSHLLPSLRLIGRLGLQSNPRTQCASREESLEGEPASSGPELQFICYKTRVGQRYWTHVQHDRLSDRRHSWKRYGKGNYMDHQTPVTCRIFVNDRSEMGRIPAVPWFTGYVVDARNYGH